MTHQKDRKVLVIILENESGALSRVVGLFSQRGFNIETLNVAPIFSDNSVSKITISLYANESQIEQIIKQLYKILPVIKVRNLTTQNENEEIQNIILDFALIKIRANEPNDRADVKLICDTFGTKIIYADKNCFIVTIIDAEDKIKNFVKILDTKVLETAHSGALALTSANKLFKI